MGMLLSEPTTSKVTGAKAVSIESRYRRDPSLRLKLRDIAFFERPVHFARPFRFGAITINATPQLFVRVEIEVEGKSKDKGSAVGASAELLVPKWFDKRPELSPAQTVDDLRRSLEIARGLYR